MIPNYNCSTISLVTECITEHILRQKGLPYLRTLRNEYYLNVYAKHHLCSELGNPELFHSSTIQEELLAQKDALLQAERLFSKAIHGTSFLRRLFVFAFCLIRVHNRNIRQRGQEDGYREGYLTGQAHRANGQEYDSSHELQYAFPRNCFVQKRTPDEQLHYKAFHMAWPSGYYDGWHGIPPWSEVDMEADRWSP